MKCPGCGNEIDEGSARCEFCGYNLHLFKDLTERGIRKITDKDVEKAYQRSEKIYKKAKKLSERGGPFAPFFKRVKVFISLIKDYKRKEYRQVPWRFIAAVVFVILYFLNPFDLIIDFIPGLGYIDDVAVMAFVIASIEFELKKYAKWKGLDLE
jgi:uncharacterized membrane protein YkvA (DUF1232 family)